MAIKNTLLGGTDWELGAALVSQDLNDTFDELYTQLTQWQ